MGKYLVKYACGHEQEVELFGPIKQRQWRLEHMADELCPECERKREAAKLAKDAEDNELPALNGSEKQVTWAMKIRHDMLKSINELSKNVEKHERNASEHPELVNDFVERRIEALKKTMSKAAMYISEETSAAFFIDNKKAECIFTFSFFDMTTCFVHVLLRMTRHHTRHIPHFLPHSSCHNTNMVSCSYSFRLSLFSSLYLYYILFLYHRQAFHMHFIKKI